MPTTDCATNIGLLSSQGEDVQNESVRRVSGGASKPVTSKPLRGLFFGFAATVTVGLALAIWYVGVRIVATNEVVPSTMTAKRSVNAFPAPTPAVAPPAVNEGSMAADYWYTVPPASRYLQVAGLGLTQDTDFASSLQAQGFRAQVQMRDGATTRILIGPFLTHAELEQGQRKLQSAGVLALETSY
jgi:hypothetical protein